MNLRIGLALVELGEAIIEYSQGASAGSSSPTVTAPAAPAGVSPQASAGAPNCPIHNVPFRTTKKDGTPVRGYCTGKMPDGSWCKERPA